MSGLCGWSMVDAAGDPSQRIDAMASELTRYDHSTVKTATGANWGAGLAAYGRDVALHATEREFAIVHGLPEIRDAELQAQAAREGLPAALAAGYRRVGARVVESLAGSFSVAIALHDESKCLCAVDRVGVDALFYAPVGEGVVFASSLAGLATHPRVSQDVDNQSIFDYFYFHVVPSPASIYRDVSRLRPGEYLECQQGEVTTNRYWSMSFPGEAGSFSYRDMRAEFHEILRTETARQLQAHDNVGCFLSGGTDSSTVAGFVARAGTEPAHTYSIGFDEPGYDEMEYARIAARHFNTDHHEYYVTPDDVVDLIPKLPQIYGQPFGNSSAVPTYFCAAMARGDGITMMLGGDGGDELFGGNERYSVQNLFSVYQKIPAGLRTALIEPVSFGMPFGEKIFPVRKLRRYIEQANLPMPDRLETYNLLNRLGIAAMFEPEFIGSVDPGWPLRHLSDEYNGVTADTTMNRMLALDVKFTLADNDLPKVVKMCELAGVQTAFPLLSDELIEFSERLPVGQKAGIFRLRRFFKAALSDFLPREIIGKPKHGFGLPIGRWLLSYPRLREMSFDALSDFKGRGIVRGEFIDDLVETKLRDYPDYYGTLVWVAMILENWFAAQQAK